ncbi:MAG: methyltransferase [Oscillospiraceae bacterium]|jgi:hypothetical protein|nr:methyltransferase [Oscillospiraceae bacterium]
MSIPKFDLKELTVVDELPSQWGAPTPVYCVPVSLREGFAALYHKKPLWQITGLEQVIFSPKVNPDNIARAFVFDGSDMPFGTGGGKDMFGIDWEFVPQVGGSMVRPGTPFLADANEWADKVVWPDIDKWDWEQAAADNAKYLTDSKYNVCWFLNGWYERLISFMDFEGAVMAMIDEDQQDAVKALFDKLTDLYIRIFDKYVTYFPNVDAFCIHDDWGSQKETFFSPATAGEMIVPYMKRVTDFLHGKGKFCELHSCGQLLKQVPNMIGAGWDSWSGQLMNDTQKIYELYGDRIIVGVSPDALPEGASEEEQRAAARAYADKFCDPGKPSMLNTYSAAMLTPAYREALYAQSRVNYSK